MIPIYSTAVLYDKVIPRNHNYFKVKWYHESRVFYKFWEAWIEDVLYTMDQLIADNGVIMLKELSLTTVEYLKAGVHRAINAPVSKPKGSEVYLQTQEI